MAKLTRQMLESLANRPYPPTKQDVEETAKTLLSLDNFEEVLVYYNQVAALFPQVTDDYDPAQTLAVLVHAEPGVEAKLAKALASWENSKLLSNYKNLVANTLDRLK